MFDIQNYTSFLVAFLILQMIPGAGTLAILTATARNGISAGLGAVAGTLFGDFLFSAMVSLHEKHGFSESDFARALKPSSTNNLLTSRPETTEGSVRT